MRSLSYGYPMGIVWVSYGAGSSRSRLLVLKGRGEEVVSGEGVRGGAENDEDMPDGVEVGMFFVVLEEIGADGIEDAFGENPEEGDVRHAFPHWPQHQQGCPSHGEVKGEG